MNITKKNFHRGYTLVETLVAVSIFSVSILGLLITLSQGIADTGYAKKKVTAAYLAGEGIEYIRNLRDTYMIYDAAGAQNGWNNFVTKLSPCMNATGCILDERTLNYASANQPMTELSILPCGSACSPLGYEASTGRYGYGTATFTDLIRTIRATQVNADEVYITSTVSWSQGSGTYSVAFSENLFSWIE